MATLPSTLIIKSNRAQVESECTDVLKTAAEVQQYWEERNRDRFAQIAAMSPPPGKKALWEKLKAQKAKHARESWIEFHAKMQGCKL